MPFSSRLKVYTDVETLKTDSRLVQTQEPELEGLVY